MEGLSSFVAALASPVHAAAPAVVITSAASHPRLVPIRRHRIDQRPVFIRRWRRRIFHGIGFSGLLHRRLAGLGRIAIRFFNGSFCHLFQRIAAAIRSLQ